MPGPPSSEEGVLHLVGPPMGIRKSLGNLPFSCMRAREQSPQAEQATEVVGNPGWERLAVRQ